jgi:hypothetical protein
MAGGILTVASSLQCPHGGQVQIIPADPLATGGSVPIATLADQVVVVGCPFVIPAVVPIPSPCILVQWVSGNPRTTANGIPMLNLSSVGLCIGATGAPQGPVVVASTPPGVQSQ